MIIYQIRILVQTVIKRIHDLTSRRVTGWINKSWALEGQLLPMSKMTDPPESELSGVVTCLKSDLMEFSHPLDQHL
jgi:hypothetical protein